MHAVASQIVVVVSTLYSTRTVLKDTTATPYIGLSLKQASALAKVSLRSYR
jgi:hypothetical protein